MAWEATPPVSDLRSQLSWIAPDRDTTSDGVIGDWKHQQGKSSHNPDDTGEGNAEWDGDADSKQEVRAADLDKDLRYPGLSMLDVVRHLVLGARSGRFWWLRYVIYQGIIYHKNSGWEARTYLGQNQHDEHAHVNMDFTQAADNFTGANYHFEELAVTPEDRKFFADKIDSVQKDVDELKAVVVGMTKLTEFAKGGGIGSPIGNAVLGHGYPYLPGEERDTLWENLQRLAGAVDDIRKLLSAPKS